MYFQRPAMKVGKLLAKARARSAISPSSHHIRSGLPLVSPPYPPSLPACCLRISPRTTISTETYHPSATSSPSPAQLCRAVASQPVEEGLDLYLPYHKHIWRLASIKTVCAWRLPSKTALYLWTFSRLKSPGRRKKKMLDSLVARSCVEC